jgi:4'-phosphopantetheinyl transferase
MPSRFGGVTFWFAQLSEFREMLSSIPDNSFGQDELDRSRRMSAEPTRATYLASCFLLRRVIGAYLDLSPPEIELVRGEHGKPSLTESKAHGILHFNLSHGGDAWLCGVSREHVIGVDVETRSRVPNAERLATRVLSAQERLALANLESSDDTTKDAAFLRCWTRKEAVLKATGSGFSWAAREIDVGIESEFKRAALPQKPGWEAGVWSIELPTSGFAAAAVIKSGTVTPPSSTMHKLSL